MQLQYNNFDIKKQVLIILVFSSWTPLASRKEVNFYSSKFPYYARINEQVRNFILKWNYWRISKYDLSQVEHIQPITLDLNPYFAARTNCPPCNNKCAIVARQVQNKGQGQYKLQQEENRSSSPSIFWSFVKLPRKLIDWDHISCSPFDSFHRKHEVQLVRGGGVQATHL